MKKFLVIFGLLTLMACAPTEYTNEAPPAYVANAYDLKVKHGQKDLNLGFDMYLGRKCNIDKDGRSWMSYVWFKFADENGNIQPLIANKDNCSPF
jgi:hypothetical protein